jgi:uncharacterized membrane protein YgdD (TMEM256/DUF423 family)
MKIGLTIAIASLSGLLAVAIGAFGAHGASTEQAKAWIVTGSQQHMAHSLALFAAAFVAAHGGKRATLAVPLFLLGIILFSGSLYALSLGAPKIVAMAAPLGGLCFIAGWGVLAWAGITLDKATS